jgi:MFS family permease
MTATDAGDQERAGSRAWVIWALGSLCFAYAFLQRVAPSVMVDELMRDFAVGAAVLGNLSAIYFYAYAGLQIPVGMALDRWGPRRMLTGAISLAALGSIVFATADSLPLAYLGRLMIGTGSAVGFVGTLMLVSRWFPVARFAFLSGMTMLVAMVGGVLGQAPLAPVVEAGGWRATIAGAGAFAVVLAAAIWLVVRDRPPGQTVEAGLTGGAAGILADLRVVLSSRQNWVVGFYGATMSGPMLSYAGLWGVPHMMQVHGLGRAGAAGSASLVLVGWAAGAPAVGWLSDRIGRRKLPLIVSAAVTLAAWIVVLYMPGLPLPVILSLLFVIGAVSAAMILCFAIAREQAPARMSGAVVGFINSFTVGAGALMQPLVGILLDLNWDGHLEAGARIYSHAAYDSAFIAMPGVAAVAVVLSFFVRETWCKPFEG